MKRTRQDIEMNFINAVSVAEELKNLSGKIDDMINKNFVRIFSDIAGNWQGENATVFNEKGDDYILGMLETADDLEKVSKNIRTTADTVYKAEKAALTITY